MWSSIEDTYRQTAQRLGLSGFRSSGFTITIFGVLGGVEVSATRLSSSQCVSRALIQPAAHLGLLVMPAGVLGKLSEAMAAASAGLLAPETGTPLGLIFGGDHVQTGDAAFDKDMTVHGHDPAAVAAVLTPEVKQLIWQMHRAGTSFVLSDVAVLIRRKIVEGEDVEGDLRAAAALASAVSAAVRASYPH